MLESLSGPVLVPALVVGLTTLTDAFPTPKRLRDHSNGARAGPVTGRGPGRRIVSEKLRIRRHLLGVLSRRHPVGNLLRGMLPAKDSGEQVAQDSLMGLHCLSLRTRNHGIVRAVLPVLADGVCVESKGPRRHLLGGLSRGVVDEFRYVESSLRPL